MLEAENQRLMRTQAEIVEDSNRRVDTHINEIRMLKEDNKKLTQNNKVGLLSDKTRMLQELRDLACFLDDDRQRARRMAREWHKFGRYTSHVMKQVGSLFINERDFLGNWVIPTENSRI